MSKQLKVLTFIFTNIIVCQIGFWFFLNEILRNPYRLVLEFNQYFDELIFLSIFLILLISFMVTMFTVINSSRFKISIIVISHLLPLLIPSIPMALFALALIVLIIIWLWLTWRIHIDFKLHLKPDILHIFSPHLNMVVIVFSLIISALFYQIGISNLDKFNPQVPPGLIKTAFDFSRPALEDQVRLQQEALTEKAIQQLDQDIPVLSDFSTEEKKQLISGEISMEIQRKLLARGFTSKQIDQLSASLKNSFSEFSQDLQGNLLDSLLQKAELQTNTILANLIETNKHLAPGILSSLIFLIFNSIGLLYRFIALSIALLLLKLMRLLKWISLSKYETTGLHYEVKSGNNS